jgi:hypothetical protein
MPAEVVTAVIAASGAVVLAGASYWFTKKREREAELRKEKLDHYKDLVSSLSGTISGESTPQGQRAFSKACNNLNLVASQAVLDALREFHHETRVSNPNKSQDRHDHLLSHLFLEIRKDLGVVPKDAEASFEAALYASGAPPEGANAST